MSECNHSPTVQLWALTNDNKCPVCLAARLAEAVAAAQTWENEAERRSRRYERAAARLAEADWLLSLTWELETNQYKYPVDEYGDRLQAYIDAMNAASASGVTP